MREKRENGGEEEDIDVISLSLKSHPIKQRESVSWRLAKAEIWNDNNPNYKSVPLTGMDCCHNGFWNCCRVFLRSQISVVLNKLIHTWVGSFAELTEPT